MFPRELRPAAFALWMLVGTIRAQGEPGPDRELVPAVVALTAELPAGFLASADLDRIAALTDRLPEHPWPELQAALDALATKLAKKMADPADAERYRSAYQRLAMHPAVRTWAAGSLLCQLGEFEVWCDRIDEGIASLQAALRREPRLQFHVAQRLCRLEGGSRQNYQAAREQLAIARRTASGACADAMRVAQLEAFLHMREGLFDSGGIALENSRRLAAQVVAEKRKLEPYDELQQLLLEMDYAAFHQDLERAIEKAEALLALPSVKPMVVERAQMVKHFCRVLLGGEPDLPHLQRMFATAAPANRDSVGSLLLEHALHAGAEDLAASVAAALLEGKSLRELSPHALVAVGRFELRPGRMPAQGSPRWREWRDALQGTWQRFLDEWRSLAPEAEGVAFLQMAVRRNVLALTVRLWHAAGEQEAAAETARLYLEVDALGSTARRLGIEAPTLDEVRRELVPADGALLVCVPAAVGSFALSATPTGWHVALLPAEGLLRQQVLELRQQAFARDRNERDDGLLAAAEHLAVRAFGPEFRRRLAGSGTLVVAARDLLHGLPLELVPTDGPRRWLGLDRPIVYLPSVAIGLHLARRPPAARTAVDVRVLAATSLGEDDAKQWHQQAVEVSAAELEATVAAIDPRRVEILAPAGVAELTRPTTDCALLAVFAHGIFDGQLACPAGLLLGPDENGGSGALFAPAVPATGLPRLLFLAVCGAARGPLRLGEDGGNRLAVAFLTAGSDLVVSGDGDVRLDEALALFRHFTDAVAAGDDPAVALWRARTRAAAASPHPGAWAGLRLEGQPKARLQLTPAAPSGRTWPWIVAAAVFLVLALMRRVCRVAVPPGPRA